MQRDMELVRKILFEIENKHIDVAIYDLEIPGYDFKTVANHCKILYEANLINDYGDNYGDNELLSYGVGGLTWEGHEFIDKIRS